MLELTNGGRMISGQDAIDFMERLADVIDEDVKTEDFCNEFTWTLNRFRYEISKSVPIPPKMETERKTVYYCGKCRRCLDPSTDKYCSGCGRAVNWAAQRDKATHNVPTCDCCTDRGHCPDYIAGEACVTERALQPCPNCGGTPKLYKSRRNYHYECDGDCWTRTKIYHSKQEAAQAWNSLTRRCDDEA